MNQKLKRIIRTSAIVIVLLTFYIIFAVNQGDKSAENYPNDINTENKTITNQSSEKDTSIFELSEQQDTDTHSQNDAKNKNTDSEFSSDSQTDKNTDTNKKEDSETDSEHKNNTDTDAENALAEMIFPYSGEWNLIVVNKYNPIPEEYEFELTEMENGKQVDSRIYDSLQEMLNAAAAEGIYADIGEAYRTTEEQEAIMDEYINGYIEQGYTEEQAAAEAKNWVALPGTSEHQLGLALDINGDGITTSDQAVYDWLAQNAYLYGFILRYPYGKEEITGIDYEAWHYRYVGETAAREIYFSGLCLEEYLSQ